MIGKLTSFLARAGETRRLTVLEGHLVESWRPMLFPLRILHFPREAKQHWAVKYLYRDALHHSSSYSAHVQDAGVH